MKAMDQALDRHDVTTLRRVIQEAPGYRRILQTDHQRRHFAYALSNAWSEIHHHELQAAADGWAWEHPAYDQALLLLRRAIDPAPKTPMELGTAAQVLVNLGNSLAEAGRYVEALEVRGRVLTEIEPKHSMAHGNNARTLRLYAQHLHDPGHKAILLARARLHLRAALQHPRYLYPEAEAAFRDDLALLDKALGNKPREPPPPEKQASGDLTEEDRYRIWAAKRRLFLNPLNDVYDDVRAAYDPMPLPSMMVDDEIGTGFQGLLNQMKQEFVTARLLRYEGSNEGGVHFADKDVMLINTLDYPKYSVRIEKTKIAFRLAYSILDKIAYFVNRYYALGVADRKVAFRTIWFDDPRKPKLRDVFAAKRNLPLRALYWVSKDLHDPVISGSTEPDAKELAELRNQLEHRYVKVHEIEWRPRAPSGAGRSPFEDWIAYHVSEASLEAKTLKMLKKARASIIYLIMSIGIEEHARHKDEKGLVLPFETDTYKDAWKR